MEDYEEAGRDTVGVRPRMRCCAVDTRAGVRRDGVWRLRPRPRAAHVREPNFGCNVRGVRDARRRSSGETVTLLQVSSWF